MGKGASKGRAFSFALPYFPNKVVDIHQRVPRIHHLEWISVVQLERDWNWIPRQSEKGNALKMLPKYSQLGKVVQKKMMKKETIQFANDPPDPISPRIMCLLLLPNYSEDERQVQHLLMKHKPLLLLAPSRSGRKECSSSVKAPELPLVFSR